MGVEFGAGFAVSILSQLERLRWIETGKSVEIRTISVTPQELPHIPNREVLDAADNLEAFTPLRKTPKEIIGHEAIAALKAAGYDIIQRVSQGDKPFP